ncbi:MAG: class I SAM-dependent methyltransferase [Syntrophobacteraceae bacterium]
MHDYIHGYTDDETTRLTDQATTLSELLHGDTSFPPNSRVLEVGCGTGAQTVYLARSSPEAAITSIDISDTSIREARARLETLGIANVTLERADLFDLPYPATSFDHAFVCFVLEHVKDPVVALEKLRPILKPGGTMTVIEGDHGSAYFFPRSDAADRAIRCQIKLQAAAGGNALIGRELYPILTKAGYRTIRVSPRMVYVDAGKPHLVDGFIRKTFTAMIEGVKTRAVQMGIMEEGDFDTGIRDLYRTAEADGVFCYTFFKAFARV